VFDLMLSGAHISVAPVAGFYSSVEIVPKAQVESAFRPFRV
jgi:hypothetical protein